MTLPVSHMHPPLDEQLRIAEVLIAIDEVLM